MEHSKNTFINISKIFAKIVIFLGIFITINSAICYYLSPTAHKSDESWYNYFDKENVDTLFIGSSVAEMVDEFTIDEYTGRNSVNMAGPSQYFASSRSILQTVSKRSPIDTVVLLIGFDALERDEDLTATISSQKAYYEPLSIKEKLSGFIYNNLAYSLEDRNIGSSDSINKWMSWPVNCISDFGDIKGNYDKKTYYQELFKEKSVVKSDRTISDFSRSSMPKPQSLSRQTKEQMEDIKEIVVDENSLMILRQMGQYCLNNGITFVVMVSPHKAGYSESFGEDYVKIDALIKENVEGVGGCYLNLNDNPFVMNLLKDEYFTDSEHIEGEGRKVVSGSISDIMNLLFGKRN